MSIKNSVFPIRPNTDLQAETHSLFIQSIDWVKESWLNILIAAGIAAVIVVVLHAARAWAMRLCKRRDGVTGWPGILGRTISKTGNFFILMTAIRLVSAPADMPLTLERIVMFLFTIAAVFQGAIWVREVIFGLIERRTSADSANGEGLASALGIIRLLVTIVLFAIAVVTVLGNIGVNVTGLIAGLGVGGIAIGLAAQGVVGDLIAALSILFDRPFRVGENIRFDNTTGTVETIGLKSTRIRAFDGELHIISNRQLLDKELHNLTDRIRIRLPFMLGIAYETAPETLDRIPALLKEIVEANGAAAVRNGFSAFGASTLDYELIAEVPSGDWNVAHPIRDRIATAILRRFAEEGISFAYPSQTTFTAAPDGKLIMPYPQLR